MNLRRASLAPLVLALAAAATAQTSSTATITNVSDLANGIFYNQLGGQFNQEITTSGAYTFGPGVHTFDLTPFGTTTYLTGNTTFLAQYGGTDLLAIALRDDIAINAIANGLDFSDVFTGTSESDLSAAVDALYDGNPDNDNPADGTVFTFFHDNVALFPALGTSGTLVQFSAATFGGTFSSTPVPVPVPEPTTVAAMGLGLVAVARRRSRR